MKSRYTTNKGMLPKVFMTEMREAYARSEKYLQDDQQDPILEQKQKVQQLVEGATP